MQTSLAKKHDRSKMVLTIAFTVICIVYVLPIVIVLINSFKTNAAVNTDTFALPNEDTFVGWQNYIKGMTFGNYPFIKAVLWVRIWIRGSFSSNQMSVVFSRLVSPVLISSPFCAPVMQ